jgi:hypothetical protein
VAGAMVLGATWVKQAWGARPATVPAAGFHCAISTFFEVNYLLAGLHSSS